MPAAGGRILKAIRPAGPIVPAQVMTAAEHAAHILATCEQECEALRAGAWSAGWAEGLAHWEAAVDAAARQADQYRASIEPELGRLAVRIAAKIVGDAVAADPSVIATVVRQALRGVGARERNLIIRVAPGAGAALESRLNTLRQHLPADCQAKVEESTAVEDGGCVIVSERGVIDARLATQLAQIERALTGGGA